MTFPDLPPDLWSLSRFLGSCLLSKFSDFPFAANSPNLPAASAQSAWLHSASQCEAPPSAPRSTEANYFFVTNLRATVEPDTLVRPLPPRRLLSVLAPQRLDELHSGVRTSTNTNLFRAAGWARKKKERRKRTTPTCPRHSCVRWHLLSWENWGEPWSCCCHSVVNCEANLKCKRHVFQDLLNGKLGWIAFKRKWLNWNPWAELYKIRLLSYYCRIFENEPQLKAGQTEGRETGCQGNTVCWATEFNRQSFLKHLTKVLAHNLTQNAHSAGRLFRALEELMS